MIFFNKLNIYPADECLQALFHSDFDNGDFCCVVVDMDISGSYFDSSCCCTGVDDSGSLLDISLSL